MTVAELIEELNEIEDKTLPVVVFDYLDGCDNLYPALVDYISEGKEYFRMNNLSQEYNCVIISGE